MFDTSTCAFEKLVVLVPRGPALPCTDTLYFIKSHRTPTGTEYILLCAWIPDDNEYSKPKLWRIALPRAPGDECTALCLRVSDELGGLDVDFRHFTVIGQRVLLMGFFGSQEEAECNAVYNAYVEIPAAVLNQ